MMLVSIVTPSLNSAAYLPAMLQSVLSQTGDFELELIVRDGGSTDGALDLLREINDPRLRWVSEPDGGQSAAINRGLAMTRGQIVTWLNCDDLYPPGTLAAVVKAFEENSSAQWLIGRCDIIDPSGNEIRQNITRYKDRMLRHFSFAALLRMNMISQPAVFWRAEFGRQIGPLDESLHWTMDYDLWLRMAKVAQPLILDRLLARFRVHMASKSRGGERGQFREGYSVARRHGQGHSISLAAHRFNIEKIVWGYRLMKWFGR